MRQYFSLILFFLIFLCILLDGLFQSTASKIPLDMAFIPSGEVFSSTSEGKVFLEAFLLDQNEVVQKIYKKVMGKNPAFFVNADKPVEKITWFEAEEFCSKYGKRLPTEWEWEYAARAGTNTHYYWGNKMNEKFAWFKANSNKQTHRIGLKSPNAFGLFDMAGNVWEWTSSDHESGGKVLRGGSWRNTKFSLRLAHRISSPPHYRYHYVGFRCAASTQISQQKLPF